MLGYSKAILGFNNKPSSNFGDNLGLQCYLCHKILLFLRTDDLD